MTEKVANAPPIDLSKLPPQAIGAAVSKLVAASIGDICMVFARSPAHRHYTFADIEWMVLPAVMTGQFHVAAVQHKEHGARAPVAVVLWASVSDETDARLRVDPGQRIRLRPDEWKSGRHLWVVDIAAEGSVLNDILRQLLAAHGQAEPMLFRSIGRDGKPVIENLADLLSNAATAGPGGQGSQAGGAS